MASTPATTRPATVKMNRMNPWCATRATTGQGEKPGSGLRVAHTHELRFAGGAVTKRYTSWRRGEHRREWSVLRLVHRDAPGLVAPPGAAGPAPGPPVV